LNLCTNVEILPPFSHTCDHNQIRFSVVTEMSTKHRDMTNEQYFNFSGGNYILFAEYLNNTSWEDNFNSCATIDDFYEQFLEILNIGIRNFIPLIRRSSKKPYPQIIKELQKKKLRVWRRLKKYYSIQLEFEYNQISSRINSELLKLEISTEKQLLESPSVNKFYKFVGKRLEKSRVIPALCGNNETAFEDSDKVRLMNEFFYTMFTKDNDTIPTFTDRTNGKFAGNLVITPSLIINAIHKLNPTTSCGPDKLPAIMFKKLTHCLTIPLTKIFNISMITGTLPAIWKNSIISPIFKKGDPSNPANYRPVSITCVTCRILESIIKQHLMKFALEKSLFTKMQYGFLPRKSCESQMLSYMNSLTSEIDNTNKIDSIYLDFSKAFDSVSHSKLLFKLSKYGINGHLLNWLKSFLTDRQQQVKIKNTLSDLLPVTSGVPQGSVLGPMLFLIFINDISDLNTDPNIKMYLFADDIKLFSRTTDSAALSQLLSNIAEWSEIWQLGLAPTKSAVIHFGHENPEILYSINGNILSPETEVKDLGIFISNDLKFSKHVSYIVKNAFYRMSLIFRCFKSRNRDLLLRAYKIYVRPILESSTAVWSPYLKKDIMCVEKVQRKFTKRLLSPSTLTYEQRLEILKLETLEKRRIFFDLCLVFKMLRNVVDLPFEDFFTNRVSTTRCANTYKITVNKCRVDCRKYFFSNRVVHIWNSLPQEIVSASHVTAFKHRLRKFDISKYTTDLT
jgi:hypothetical protein